MRIGFSLLNNWGIEDAQALASLASRAEELGFDSVWVHDHVFDVRAADPPELRGGENGAGAPGDVGARAALSQPEMLAMGSPSTALQMLAREVLPALRS